MAQLVSSIWWQHNYGSPPWEGLSDVSPNIIHSKWLARFWYNLSQASPTEAPHVDILRVLTISRFRSSLCYTRWWRDELLHKLWSYSSLAAWDTLAWFFVAALNKDYIYGDSTLESPVSLTWNTSAEDNNFTQAISNVDNPALPALPL